jgi:hypothetical protein
MGNRAWDMITVRNEMQNAMEPKYGQFQKNVLDPLAQSYKDYGKEATGKVDTAYSDIMSGYDSLQGKFGGFKSGTVDPLKNQMMGMMTDESKRGYSQDTQNAMFSKQAEALGGAKTSYMKNLGRTLASQGLGGASGGARNRMLNQYESQHASNLRESSRDVKLADAEAKRADLWNAVQGYGTAAGLEAQGLGMETSALGSKANAASSLLNTGINAGFSGLAGEAGVAGMGAQNIRDEQNYWGEKAAQSQAYSGVKNSEQGFWKSFKNSLGSGLAGMLTGQNAQKAIGGMF